MQMTDYNDDDGLILTDASKVFVTKAVAALTIPADEIAPESLDHPTHRWSIRDGKKFGLGDEPGEEGAALDWEKFNWDDLEESLPCITTASKLAANSQQQEDVPVRTATTAKKPAATAIESPIGFKIVCI